MTITLDGTLGVTTPAETITGTLAVTGITTVAAGTAALPSIISTTGTADTGQWFPAADTIAYSTAGLERVRITSGGLVGIGVTPGAALHVFGNNGSFGFNSFFGLNGSTAGIGIGNNATIGLIQGATTATSGTTADIAMQSSGGNLLIGTTTASSRLTIKQSADGGAGGITLVRQANTNNWQAVVASTNDLYLIYNGTDRGYFSNTNGAYTSISDKRLKENIFKIPYGLNSVLALNPVQYNMIGHEANQLGFIAQEVQEIIPESVSEMMGGNLGMDKSSIIPVLVKAIQEQQAIIEKLTARITALETE